MKQFTNTFDGPSLLVLPGADLAKVEFPFRSLLTEEHREAFYDTPGYFGKLASQCPIDSMKVWLEHLAQSPNCEIEINISKWATETVVKVSGYQLSLRERIELPSEETALIEFYSLIRGTWERGFPIAGGLHEPRTVEEYGLRPDPAFELTDDSIAFYTVANGDSLIALEDIAYWYSHESCDIVREGTVRETLARYFETYLRGKCYPEFQFPWDKLSDPSK